MPHAYAKIGFWNRHVRGRMRLMRKEGVRELLAPTNPRECNVCGHRGAFSSGRQCPACKSSNCHRLILWYFENEMTEVFTAKLRVLQFAPELCLSTIFRSLPNIRYETADLKAKGVDHHFDLQTYDGPLGPFDIVMANHVLEHIPDDRAALRNIFRMVKPGGLAMFTVPVRTNSDATDDDPTVTDPAERKRRYGEPNHVRFYGRDLVERIAQAGFAASIWEPPAGAPTERYAMGGEVIFLGRKQS